MPTNAIAAGAYAATQGLLHTPSKPGAAQGATGLDFSSLIQGAIGGVAQAGQKAEAQALAAAGGKADIVDVVTAVAESEAALETLVAVRDRVIAAYEEIMRMPI
jgi:flagellar hook-basal body complex protein FliE